MGIMGVVHMMRCCVVIPKLPLEIGCENVGQREVGGLRCELKACRRFCICLWIKSLVTPNINTQNANFLILE